ncbi:MAG: leucine-rich repeat domain-containing protein, partial [Clostridia bacterium]|nr:leucine-rich repeat domain-containing protein [Clostridia bacterium]
APAAQDGQTCTWYNSPSKNVVYDFSTSVIANTTLYGVLYTQGLVVKGNTVTEYNGTESQVFIPQTNNGVYVTTIAPNVFADNNNVSSVYVPSTVQVIGDYAFYNCEYLETINVESTIKSIGKFAFAGCKRLVSDLDLSGLTAVQQNTFASCKALTNVVFGDKLVTIGAYAFTDCKALAQVNIPNSVQAIGEYAFANTAITNLSIPNSLTTLGQGAVKGCNLQSIAVDQNSNFVVKGNTLYADQGKTLFLQFGTVETVVVEDSVEAISPWAFSSATVVNLDLSAVATAALQKSFLSGIEGLKTLKVSGFSQDNEYLAYWFGASSAIENTTASFYVPTTLTSVQFATAQTKVPAYAFYGCNSLQTVEGFEQVEEIGSYAYAHTGVTNIHLSTALTKLAGTSFAGANKLVVTLDEQNTSFAMYDGAIYTKDLTKLLLVPSSKTEIDFAPEMTIIGEDAFAKTSIAEVVVPNTVEEICYGAFEDASLLQKLTVPFIGGGKADNLYMLYIFGAKVTFDPETYSAGITGDKYPMSLKEITLSNPVTTIPDVAFLYCKGLEKLNNDAEVTSIGHFAFYNTGFTKVEIADSVTTIGVMAYAKSEKISEVVIGSGVTQIMQQAFASLTMLQKVTFEEGENDLVIGDEAFLGNFDQGNNGYVGRSYLEEIKFSNNIVSIGSMAFAFAGAYGTDTEDYFKLDIRFDVKNSRLKTIGEMAFGFSAAEKVYLPASLEILGPMTFFNSPLLSTVHFGSAASQAINLVLIDDGAFAGCIGLKSVYLFRMVANENQVPVLGLKTNSSTKGFTVFFNCEVSVYVPRSCLEIYQSAWAGEKEITLKSIGGM